MSTNDKDWNEFWDNEGDDDDECNDLGSDVDANNDETFDNAAEWNEDEHEELIARDSILSHSIRNNSHSSNNRQINNNRTNNNHHHNNNNNYQFNNNNNNSANDASGSSSSNYVVNLVGSVGRSGWNSVSDIESFPVLSRQLDQSTSSDTRWQNTSDRLHRLQIQQQQLLAQQRLQEQEQQQKQQVRDREFLRQQQREKNYSQIAQSSPQADVGRQVLRVDELERQLLKTRIGTNEKPGPLDPLKRTGWSPFGGKDLFTNPESPTQTQFGPTGQKVLMQSNLPQSLTLEQQQQILLQQHQILQQQHQLQQMAMLKQQQIQQEQRLMSQNPQCFTVEELEKQLVAGRSSKLPDVKEKKLSNHQEELVKLSKVNDKHENHNNTHDKRIEDRHERYERYERDSRDNRDHRDRRDHRVNRDHRQHNRRQFTIIPPQVQLSVIDKVKLLHSITAMHPDEFLQDRMPTAKEGFLFKRHSSTLSAKSDHDGVLTEKERNWLTKIQEKIQADYDDNIDQDYYYLLYFNRFSMADEAAQKPYGSGVMDRRFIPRERLLYNSST